jgi:thiol-disulfide isomerase/thioredoxin
MPGRRRLPGGGKAAGGRMSTRRLLAFVALVVAGVVTTVFVRSLTPPESPSGSLAFLSAAPELPVFDASGGRHDLSKEKGRLTLIHFWATFCPPCVEEIPELSAFWERYKGRDDIRLYVISVDKDWDVIRKFTTKNPNSLPMYHDPGAATAKRFGTTQYPETYIVNAKGRVLFRVQGVVSWSDPEVRRRIEQLLAS